MPSKKAQNSNEELEEMRSRWKQYAKRVERKFLKHPSSRSEKVKFMAKSKLQYEKLCFGLNLKPIPSEEELQEMDKPVLQPPPLDTLKKWHINGPMTHAIHGDMQVNLPMEFDKTFRSKKKVSPYTKFVQLPEDEAARWRARPELRLSQIQDLSLNEQADILENKILQKFVDEMKEKGLLSDNVGVQYLKELLSVGAKLPVNESVFTYIESMACVKDEIALRYKEPDISDRAAVRMNVIYDNMAEGYRKKMKKKPKPKSSVHQSIETWTIPTIIEPEYESFSIMWRDLGECGLLDDALYSMKDEELLNFDLKTVKDIEFAKCISDEYFDGNPERRESSILLPKQEFTVTPEVHEKKRQLDKKLEVLTKFLRDYHEKSQKREFIYSKTQLAQDVLPLKGYKERILDPFPEIPVETESESSSDIDKYMCLDEAEQEALKETAFEFKFVKHNKDTAPIK